MKAGIRFSSICPISPVVLTVPTTSKPSASRSMRIAASAASISPTDSTLKRSSPRNSSSSCPFRRTKARQPRPSKTFRRSYYPLPTGVPQINKKVFASALAVGRFFMYFQNTLFFCCTALLDPIFQLKTNKTINYNAMNVRMNVLEMTTAVCLR